MINFFLINQISPIEVLCLDSFDKKTTNGLLYFNEFVWFKPDFLRLMNVN